MRIIVVLLCGLLASACDPNSARRHALEANIQSLTAEFVSTTQSVVNDRAAAGATQLRVSQLEAELDDFQRRVRSYMMNHKMAVAAIAAGLVGGGVALESGNAFSQDIKNAGGVIAAIAALYALNNAGEVTEVLDQIMQANAHVNDLKAQIDESSAARDEATTTLVHSEQRLQEVTKRLEAARAELAELR
jgi:peptidoglycan hydrolase CwlO-like protein